MSKKKKVIDAIYGLSPMQQGMLFHTLYDAGAGVYVEQTSLTLQGDLVVGAFQRAWEQVLERHTIFRTAFVWEHRDKPLQAVYRHVRLPWAEEDWREHAPEAQEQRLAAFLAADRQRGFVLSQAPLMRLSLFRIADDVYRFVWSSHHLLIDGWSVALVLNEVFACYDAWVRGQELYLPPARPYRDYIAWLEQQDLAAAETFWRRTLAGFHAPTPFGVDRPLGSSDERVRYAAYETQIAESASHSLQELTRRHGLTLNTIVQGAWALLLSCYSGEKDVVFGAIVAGRPPELAGVESMVGVFINTVPVRTKVEPGATLLAWLAALQTQQAEARQYEYTSLVQIQGWSAVPRGQALFESIIVFENHLAARVVSPPTDRSPIVIRDICGIEQNNYPLTLIVRPDQGFALQVSYDCRRFEVGVIERMLGHLRALIEDIAALSDRRLADVSLMPRAERDELMITRNATQEPYPADRCFHQLFEAQVERTPDAVALQTMNDEGGTMNGVDPAFIVHRSSFIVQMTYAELNRRANQLAHHLQTLGVRRGARVGICIERSPEMVIGLLGIFKAGGAFVPLDPSFPRQRKAFVLDDSQAAVLITATTDHRRPTTEGAERPVVVGRSSLVEVDLARDWPAIARQPADSPAGSISGADLAYVIYTSGSTGKPKGVLIPHSGLTNYLVWCAVAYGAAQGWGAPVQSSIAADAIFPSLFAPLIVGTTVLLLPEDQPLDALNAALRNLGGFSLIKITPSQLELLNQIVPAQAVPRAVGTLVVGAEEVRGEVLAFWQTHAPDTHVLNEYGPTETVVGCSIYPVPPGRSIRGSVPIGLPIANTQFYVLDRHMRPVPIDVPGELYIGGDGVAWGYHNRPDLTAERFVPDPFATTDDRRPTTDDERSAAGGGQWSVVGGRLYRTGDLVRYLPDRSGNIEFLGRIDDQVKIRGYRVEPGEVAAALMEHAGVREAVVLARADVAGERRLVAYVVTSDKLPVTSPGDSSLVTHNSSLAAELRSFLAAHLPEYMIPGAFVFLDALPLAAHGKIDRQALPVPERFRAAPQESFVAPRTPIEEVLAQIWSDLLHIDQVGAQDNFFALGGHSLLAMQLVARVRAAFQVELPLRSLFEAPTVASLAARVVSLRRDRPQPLPPPLIPVSHDAALPLSFAQQRLWFLNQIEPDSPAYNVPAAMRLFGRLDRIALERSLNLIVQRHAILRTTFEVVDEQPAQVIAAARAIHLDLIDLESLPEQEREAAALRLAVEEAQKPFDLAAGPLLRTTLLRLGEDAHLLLLSMHHIISDGWSIGIFVRELTTLYAGFTDGARALPELPIQYADFAVWQREWLQGSLLEAQLPYWRARLADLSVLALPTDRPRPTVQTFRGAAYEFALPLALTEALIALSRQEEVTLFMTLLAAWQVLLARYSGQSDIAVGTPIANRTYAEIEPLIGCFVNTLVLRTAVEANSSFYSLLEQVREVCVGGYTHQDLPFEQLVEALAPTRDLSRTPLFQVMFVLQNIPIANSELAGLTIEPLEIAYGTAKFDLSLFMGESEAGLVGVLEYSTDLFAASTIERMVGHFEVLLQGIVAQPEQRVAELPLLGPAERHQILVEWNATERAFPDLACLHQLFEAQAVRTPDAIALVLDATTDDRRPTTNRADSAFSLQMTYAELERRANQLAHHLRSLGIEPEALVGVCMERSVELVIALLGVLKAGGAYVPLDPDYPAERLAFMLEDAGAAVLITTTDDQRSTTDEDAGWSVVSGRSSVVQTVDLARDWPTIAHQPTANPDVPLAADSLAYAIYTSGSTGKPKGAMNTHRGIVNRLLWMQDTYHLAPDDAVLQKTTISFDVSVWELFWPLLAGARLVLAQPEGHKDPAYLLELIAAQRITTLHFVPSMLTAFLAEPTLARARSLRRVICSGEALTVELVAQAQATLAAPLYNLYGPTEAAVDVTFWACASDAQPSAVPIGRPVANTQIYLLDQQMQPLPIGVAGELCIGGVQLARGYLGRPELTAERFIPNPFLKDEGGGMKDESGVFIPHPSSFRLYKTGDLARYRADGAIEYLGRRDQQVKLRGMRIELGEIEAALRGHVAVREAALLLREDVPGQKRLIAYVVTSEELRVTSTTDSSLVTHNSSLAAELRSFLAERLPSSMLPTAFVLLEALPLTPSGKLDRRALPAPAQAAGPGTSEFRAPRTPAEATLAQIWAEVLRLERVGLEDNFFALGGDSILSLQVVARARQAGLQLIPRHLFQHQTVGALAAVAEPAPAPAPKPEVVDGPLPLTPIQRWFFAQDLPNQHHFNQVLLLAARQGLDPALLGQALQHLLRRHDALRLRFVPAAGGWQQEVGGVAQPIVWHVELSALATAQQESVRAMVVDAAHVSLNLAHGPLLRVVLFARGHGQAPWLLLVAHHLVIDTVSWGVVLEELQSAYVQLAAGQALALPPVTSSFATWASELYRYAQSASARAELGYWHAVRRGPLAPLPRDWPGGANRVAEVDEVVLKLDEARTQALITVVPQAYGTRIQEVLLTALALALAEWSPVQTHLVEVEGHGRDGLAGIELDLSRTVGWFTTLYPLRLELPAASLGLGAALKAIKEQVRGVPTGGLGYGVLRELSEDAEVRAALGQGAAELSFNYLGKFDQLVGETEMFYAIPEGGGATQDPRGQRSHLLELVEFVSAGQLHMRWVYSRAIHARSTIERLAQSYLHELQGLIAHCQSPDAGGYTPADFPLAQLDQHELDLALEGVEFEGE